MSRWSAEQRELAYQAYLQCMNCEGVYRMLGRKIKLATIERWRTEYRWDQRVEADQKAVTERLETDEDLTKLMQKFGMDERHIDTLQELRIVSTICLSRILGKELPKKTVVDGDEERKEDMCLVPGNFNDALAGLKACWKARKDLLSTIPEERRGVQEEKVDMFAAVQENDDHIKTVN